ncbi:MAG: hypothetical protein LBI41_01095 [Lactobacillales bacterium]|jgi:predicted transcriptional regulator YdeE|nr:hypothetical protein [Lactobacillales bacterium]
MAYQLSGVTIRTENTAEGMKKISELWEEINTGKLPLLFDNQHVFQPGISPVSRYSNYENDENGAYDLSIIGVRADFFQQLEQEVAKGNYKKYDESDENGDVASCAKKAWEKVWQDSQTGVIKRAFTVDYESSVPVEYTKDGKAHCYLYIAQQV